MPFHGYLNRADGNYGVWGMNYSKPRDRLAGSFCDQIDRKLLADAGIQEGMPRVISLLEEIRDRLAGVRPTIHVPTADECRRFGGKGVR